MEKDFWLRGMTLVETAVLLSIVSIASTLAIPSILELKPRFQLNSQVSSIQNDLQRAKIKSISMNTRYCLNFYLGSYPNPDIYTGYFYDVDSGTWVVDSEMNSLKIAQYVDIAYIDNVSQDAGLYTIDFFPDGTCESEIIYLTNTKGLQRKIDISENTGFVRVFKGW